ncbi:MAG: OmpH family outer membrane protein [Planctomycetota bacterium]
MRSWIIAAAVGAVVILALRVRSADTGEGAAAGAGAGFKVGVVDLDKVFKTYKHSIELNDQLKKWIDGEKDKRTALENEIKKLEQELQDLNPTSKSHESKAEDLYRKQVQLTATLTSLKDVVEMKQMKYTAVVYEEVRAEVKKMAEDEGYDLVLFTNATGVQGQRIQGLVDEIKQRTVLYHRPQMDATDALLDRLNKGGGRRK